MERNSRLSFVQFESDSGEVIQRRTLSRRGHPVAGLGKKIVGGFVAHYIDPADRKLYVQFGEARIRLDGVAAAAHRWNAAGFLSVTSVHGAGGEALELRDWVGPKRLWRAVDSRQTAPESLQRDFLLDLTDGINSADRRAAAFSGWNPIGTP